MTAVMLVHWKAQEQQDRLARLRRLGFSAEGLPEDGRAALQRIRTSLPDALIIDLSRLPSHGRELAREVRRSVKTRTLPLVFVDGAPEKVERTRSMFPDAAYTSWARLQSALQKAVAHPPADPVVPASLSGPNSPTPLAKKLGIKDECTVALIGAPKNIDAILKPLPRGARIRRSLRGPFDLMLWFVRSGREFEDRLDEMALRVPPGGLWICWPKKGSPLAADLNGNQVREEGVQAGLVDYKVCAIDRDWSGLKFARRKKNPG